MTSDLTTERLEELRATVPYLSLDDAEVSTQDKTTTEAVLAYFADNAHKFADPGKKDQCVNCGRAQGGLLGAFQWGIIHGEGSCSNCGWPARMYHFVDIDGERQRVTALLQYHPDGIVMEASNGK